ACLAGRWCWRARGPDRGCRRVSMTATLPTATGRCPGVRRPMRWRRCCRCSTRSPRTIAPWPCTPARIVAWCWTSRMAEQPLLHRGNVAVVIPALNEALRIADVVAGALAQSDLVIVVDDGSDDDTAAIVDATPAVLLRHPRRMGKGRALRAGF